jgi:hypothetical protein
MHCLYLALFEPDLPARKSDGEDATKPQVTYEKYNERFKTFDLAVDTHCTRSCVLHPLYPLYPLHHSQFGKPAVDSCATCDTLIIQLSAAETEDTANTLRAARRAHLLEADAGYAMRKHDQELAQVHSEAKSKMEHTSPDVHATHFVQESRRSDPDWHVPASDYRTWDGHEFVSSDMMAVLQTPKVLDNTNASPSQRMPLPRFPQTRHSTYGS